jgi:hypothetical protein
MADAYVRNLFPSTYGAALSAMVEMLVSAGWSYKASGDGLAGYSSTSKIFTGTGSGALGWNNAKAWARIQNPAGTKEWLFQHDAAGGARIRYSPAAKFTGGSPSATVTPTATDAVTLRGGGTDATPTYGAGWFTSAVTTSGVVFQGLARGSAPYGFWFAGQVSSGGAKQACLIYDPVTGAPEDLDPYVIQAAHTNACLFNGSNLAREYLTNGADPRVTITPGAAVEGCFGFMDLALTSFVYLQPPGYIHDTNLQFSSGTMLVCSAARGVANPFNAKHEALPIPYLRPAHALAAASCGFKGWSTMTRWTTVARASFSDTLDSKAWICFGALWLAWDGVTVPTP